MAIVRGDRPVFVRTHILIYRLIIPIIFHQLAPVIHTRVVVLQNHVIRRVLQHRVFRALTAVFPSVHGPHAADDGRAVPDAALHRHVIKFDQIGDASAFASLVEGFQNEAGLAFDVTVLYFFHPEQPTEQLYDAVGAFQRECWVSAVVVFGQVFLAVLVGVKRGPYLAGRA